MSDEQYLADGVYVEMEGETFRLTTRDGNSITNTIFLELETATLLLAYINEKIEEED